MLELFRSNNFIYSLLIIVYVTALNISGFFVETPIPLDGSPGILSRLIFGWLENQHVLLDILNIVIIFLQASMVNRLVNMNRLSQSSNLFPGVFFVLASSLTSEYIPLQPIVLANTFIIWMFYEIFSQSRNENLPVHTFNVGALVSVASLLYLPYLAFFVVALFSLVFIRTFKVVDFFRLLTGLVAPYLLFGTLFFLIDHNDWWVSYHSLDNFHWIDLNNPRSMKTYLLLSFLFVLVALALAFYNRLGKSFNIHIKRKVNVIYWFLFGSIAALVLSPIEIIYNSQMIALPLGILLGLSLFSLDNKPLAEVLHLIIFCSALIFQFLF